MVRVLHYLILSMLVFWELSSGASWLQQYADSRSSSYTEFAGSHFTVGWNFTSDPFASLESPAVASSGAIFVPGRAYLTAVGPNGSVLWKTGIAPNGNAYQTNVLYYEPTDTVILGTSWVENGNFFMLAAVDASSGTVVWTSQQNQFFHATSLSISAKTEAVYLAGWDHQTFGAVHLKDGRLLWKVAHVQKLGIFMQTKACNGGAVILLPTDPWDGFEGKGRLLAYGSDSPPAQLWHSDVGFDAGGQFACISSGDDDDDGGGGVVYGSVGGGGGPQGQTVYAVDWSNGSVLWNRPSPCDSPAGTSGPAVDPEGNVYYNCGNRVVSLDGKGNLRWSSRKIGNATLASVTSPAVHPSSGRVFFIHNDHSSLHVLASASGRLLGSFALQALGYIEPPILLGDSLVYLVGILGNSVRVYSLKV